MPNTKQKKLLIELYALSKSDEVCYNPLRGYKRRVESVFNGSLDILHFGPDDVRLDVEIDGDGDDSLLLLKNGDLYNVCWRGNFCRVWKEEDDDDLIHHIQKLVTEYLG